MKLRKERSSQVLAVWLVSVLSLVLASPAAALPGIDAAWNPGSPDCAKNPQPPLEVHAYDSRTFVIRENPCSTFEAPFMYLLIGSTKAMLIDSGDVADPKAMPLADTVMQMLPGEGPAKLPLLVVHTHRHLDHRAGDTQFARLPNVVIVGFDIESVLSHKNGQVSEDNAGIWIAGRTRRMVSSRTQNEIYLRHSFRQAKWSFSRGLQANGPTGRTQLWALRVVPGEG